VTLVWRRLVASALLVIAAVTVAACITRTHGNGDLLLLTGRADAAEESISISTDDWTYAVGSEGVAWVDKANVLHMDGRPECLTPGVSRQVDFAAIEVTVEQMTWRPVVWVSCR